MNVIFALLFSAALAFAAWTGNMKGFTDGLFGGVKSAVDIAIGLTGVLALWLGLVKILERAGAVDGIARFIGPVMRLIFPGIPKEHPAITAMTLNIAANMLGLGNAATPLGLKAMEELEKLNPKAGIASDPQAVFIAINTANVTLVPATIIALRASAKSSAPADIIFPAMVASGIATIAAIVSSRALAKLSFFRKQYESAPDKPPPTPTEKTP